MPAPVSSPTTPVSSGADEVSEVPPQHSQGEDQELLYQGPPQPQVLIVTHRGMESDGLYSNEIREFMGKWFTSIQLEWTGACGFLQIPLSLQTAGAPAKSGVLEEIRSKSPKVILSFGQECASYLLGSRVSLETLRGQVYRVENYPLLPTYEPPQVFENPQLKRPVWEDLKRLRGILDYG